MKRGQKSSRTQSRKLVKNKLMIGDSNLAFATHPNQRSLGSQNASYNKVNRSNVGIQNFYLKQLPDKLKRVPQVDGGKFKREVAAKKQRAADVYGSRSKALAESYRRDKTTGKKIKSKKTERCYWRSEVK